jgi:hypothetical protein
VKRVVATLLIAASCSVSMADTTGPAPRAAVPNTERLRALDWTPFETALARFPADRAAAIDRLMPAPP